MKEKLVVKSVIESQTSNLHVNRRSVFSTENGIACEDRQTLQHMEASALALLTGGSRADWQIDMDTIASARTKQIGGNAIDFMNAVKMQKQIKRVNSGLTLENGACGNAPCSFLWSDGSSQLISDCSPKGSLSQGGSTIDHRSKSSLQGVASP